MKKITPKFSHVSGSFDMTIGKLVSVPKHKYQSVDLCLSDSVNIPFAEIVLREQGFASFGEVYEDAKALGNEIVARWNNHAPKSIEEIKVEFENWLVNGSCINAVNLIIYLDYSWIDFTNGYHDNEIDTAWRSWKASRAKALEINP